MPDVILGFDYSSRKIGIATGQRITCTATPLTTLVNPQKGVPDWHQLDQIIARWRADILVVGLPLALDGSDQQTTLAARNFGEQLYRRYQIKVEYMDERFSSREASHLLGYDGITSPARSNRPGKKNKKNKPQGHDIDNVAAQLILQSWLQQ